MFRDFVWIRIRSKRWGLTPAAGVQADKNKAIWLLLARTELCGERIMCVSLETESHVKEQLMMWTVAASLLSTAVKPAFI